MKKQLSFLLCFTTSIINAAPLSDVQKRAFVDFYRPKSELSAKLCERPYNPVKTVLFFDLNGNGLEDAIVQDTEWVHNDGANWYVFVQTATSWDYVKYRDLNELLENQESTIYAQRYDFRILTRENEPPQLVVINNHRDKVHVGYERRIGGEFVFFHKDDEKFNEMNDWEEVGEDDVRTVIASTLTLYTIAIDEEGYLKVVEIKSFLNMDFDKELDELWGQGKYKLESIFPVTYTNVPAIKPEEFAQLAVTNPALAEFLASRAQTTNSIACFDDAFVVDVPAPPPQNVKPPFIKKWLPVFIVVVLYVVWRVTRHRFQNKTRQPQPPATE